MLDDFRNAAIEPKDQLAMAYMARELEDVIKTSPKRELLESGLDYVDLTGNLYTSEERVLLRALGERFPRIKLGFLYFGLLSSNQRPFEALAISDIQPRSGWLRIGVPTGWVQSIKDHHQSCIILAKQIFKDDPELDQICKTLKYHDIGESVIGDFTPHCPISKEEKIAAEDMAVRLITSARTRGHPLAIEMDHSFRSYEGLLSVPESVRKKAKDIDLGEMILESPMIRHKCPLEERAAIDQGLAEFEAYVETRLSFDCSKAFVEGIVKAPDRYAHPQKIWQHAFERMELQI